MASDIQTRVREALKTVRYPGMSRDIVSFGFVRQIEADGGHVIVELSMSTHNPEAAEQVSREIETLVGNLPEVEKAEVRLELTAPAATAQRATAREPGLLPGVRHVIAVASGKGGVGKSTVSANLAVRMAQMGHRVGLLDADIYGPSLPTMFGITARPQVSGNTIVPFEKYGIHLMSLGFLIETDTPVIWRGPMVMKALMQLLGEVAWGELDYLIVDLPPGTGDVQLTLAQKVPMSGSVIVTTPQDVALIDARKGLAMFRKVNVPVVGIVENMSGFACPHCGETTDIFKRGGGETTAEILGCAYLGAIPLDPLIVQGGDSGEPIVVSQPEGPHADAFKALVEAVDGEVKKHNRPALRIVSN
jgi:ATP-binding protein involved in chromosome partitioning